MLSNSKYRRVVASHFRKNAQKKPWLKARGIGKSSRSGGHHEGRNGGRRPECRPEWCPPRREDFPIPRAVGPWDFHSQIQYKRPTMSIPKHFWFQFFISLLLHLFKFCAETHKVDEENTESAKKVFQESYSKWISTQKSEFCENIKKCQTAFFDQERRIGKFLASGLLYWIMGMDTSRVLRTSPQRC